MGNCEAQHQNIPELFIEEIVLEKSKDDYLHKIINNVVMGDDNVKRPESSTRCKKPKNGLCIADDVEDKSGQFCVGGNKECGMKFHPDKYKDCGKMLDAVGEQYIVCRDGYKPTATKVDKGDNCQLTCAKI